MMLELTRPLIVLDFETTGTDPDNDFIIDIGAVKVNPDGTRDVFESLILPPVTIPSEVVELTGITNEMVQGAPMFRDVAADFQTFLAGCDIAGFGVARFDAKVLAAEFNRAGVAWSTDGIAIVDAQRIFHKREPRDLTAAVKFYTGLTFDGAHRAMADVLATISVIEGQVAKYLLTPDVATLAKECEEEAGRYVDKDRKLFWRNGEAAFAFGKYRSRTLRDVIDNEPGYIRWLLDPTRNFGPDFTAIVRDAARRGIYPVKGTKDGATAPATV